MTKMHSESSWTASSIWKMAAESSRLPSNSKDFKSLSQDERRQRRYELPETISIWICGFHPRDGVSDISDTWAVYSQCDLEKGGALPLSPKNKYIASKLAYTAPRKCQQASLLPLLSA